MLCLTSQARADGFAVNGAELAYEEAGKGSVVLFVHGAVSDHRVWDEIREQVAAQHRVVAYDQRYFGPTDWSDAAEGFNVATHANDLVAVVDVLEAGPVHVVGWSYGGLVAIHAALSHPEKFRSLVLFEPTIESLHSGLSGERAAITQKSASFGPMAEALQNGSDKQAVRRLIEVVFRMDSGAADEFPEAVQQMWDDNARTLTPFLAALSETPPVLCENIASLDIPTLVIQGSDSYVLDAMMSDELARCLPKGSTFVLDGVNHGGPVQKPEEFTGTLLGFTSLQ